MKLTVVIGFRDREIDRIERCLKSLEAQTFRDFELIFVDYGSQTATANAARQTVEKFSFAKYVYSDTRGHPWNRSRALNIGAKLSEAEYIFTTDVDILFPPNFLNVVIANAQTDRVLYCAPYYLPENFLDWEKFYSYEGKFHIGGIGHKGGCQVIAASVFRELRGFDETYQYWGLEDRDMNHRLLSMNIQEVWLNDQTYMFHQWHPSANYRVANVMPDGYWGRVQVYYYKQQGVLQRNPRDWGRILSASERGVFEFIDFENARLVNEEKVRILDIRPDSVPEVGKFVNAFYEIPQGCALAVLQAGYPRPSGFADFLVSITNRLLYWRHVGFLIGYPRNLLHNFIADFVEQNPELVADYYLNFPALNGVALLTRGERV